jgi:hypothetical protein
MELTSVAIHQYAMLLVGAAVLAMNTMRLSPPTVTEGMEGIYMHVMCLPLAAAKLLGAVAVV